MSGLCLCSSGTSEGTVHFHLGRDASDEALKGFKCRWICHRVRTDDRHVLYVGKAGYRGQRVFTWYNVFLCPTWATTQRQREFGPPLTQFYLCSRKAESIDLTFLPIKGPENSWPGSSVHLIPRCIKELSANRTGWDVWFGLCFTSQSSGSAPLFIPKGTSVLTTLHCSLTEPPSHWRVWIPHLVLRCRFLSHTYLETVPTLEGSDGHTPLLPLSLSVCYTLSIRTAPPPHQKKIVFRKVLYWKNYQESGMAVHTCKPSTWVVGAGDTDYKVSLSYRVSLR